MGRVGWGAATSAAMSRKLVWIEQQRFRGWGCSECAWVFNPSGALTGKSYDEANRNFELQRRLIRKPYKMSPKAENAVCDPVGMGAVTEEDNKKK
jgi:hypothetical protein